MKINRKQSYRFKKAIKPRYKKRTALRICAGLVIVASIVLNPSSYKNNTPESTSVNATRYEKAQITSVNIEGEKKRTEEAITTEEPTAGYVALTYDDGPSPTITPEILQILRDNNSVATFFVLGSRVILYPDVVLETYLDGNEIGNHGYDHQAFTNLTTDEIHQQITVTDEAIIAITNKVPTFVRPPYGAITKDIADQINRPLILWSIDSNDWRNIPADIIIDNVMSQLQDGSIILFHDIHRKTLEISRELIPMIIEAGYELVTLEQLFEIKEVQVEPSKIYHKAKK
mgnify:CR=1 FL=1